MSSLERHGWYGFVSLRECYLERSLDCILTHIGGCGIVNNNCGALGLINLLSIAILHLNEGRLLQLIFSQLLIVFHSDLALVSHVAIDLDLTAGGATGGNLLGTWRDHDCGWTEVLDLDASRLALGYLIGPVG